MPARQSKFILSHEDTKEKGRHEGGFVLIFVASLLLRVFV